MATFKPAPPMSVFFNSYKRVLLRDPISLKLAMSIASIFLGIAFIVTDEVPGSAIAMAKLLDLWVWGTMFLMTGLLRLSYIGDSVLFPYSVRIVTCLLSLYLWVHLNVSSFQSPRFDALNSLLFMTIVFECWSFVHTLFPHRPPGRCTDDSQRFD